MNYKNVSPEDVFTLIKYLIKAQSDEIPSILIFTGFHGIREGHKTDEDVKITDEVRKVLKDLNLTKK